MRKADIKIGESYSMLVSQRVVRVTVTSAWDDAHWRTGRHQRRYSARNEATGRVLGNLSAARFRARWRPEFHGAGNVAERPGDLLESDFAKRERDAERVAVAERDAQRRQARRAEQRAAIAGFGARRERDALEGFSASDRVFAADMGAVAESIARAAGEWFNPADRCEACGGSIETLGALGNTAHGRCRGCGADVHAPIEETR